MPFSQKTMIVTHASGITVHGQMHATLAASEEEALDLARGGVRLSFQSQGKSSPDLSGTSLEQLNGLFAKQGPECRCAIVPLLYPCEIVLGQDGGRYRPELLSHRRKGGNQ